MLFVASVYNFAVMCGIFGYIGKKDFAAEIVYKGLKKLEYRGYDSWGIAYTTVAGKLQIVKKTGKIGGRKHKFLESHFALGHTRWATHGGVTKANAHPHLACDSSLAIVHNGVIENYQELKKSLKKAHKFKSETDTEVYVHILEEKLKSTPDLIKAVRETFMGLQGLNSIIVIDIKNSRLIAIKNGSPLVMTVTDDGNYIASDTASLLEYNNKVIFLEDLEMAVLSAGGIQVFNVVTGKKLTLRHEQINWTPEEINLGKYGHFMLKEIEEQPRILFNMVNNAKIYINDLADYIRNHHLCFIACGSAYYASLEGVYFFNKILKISPQTTLASEYTLYKNINTKKTVLFALSQSGETIDLIDAVRIYKKRGIKVVSLINNPGSTLARISDKKYLLNAGPEMAVAATKSFTTMVAYLYVLAYALHGNISYGLQRINQVARGIDIILKRKFSIRKIAQIIAVHNKVFIIGRELLYPIALEASLKIKEVTYIHAEGFAGGELKHGPIAMVEKGTPCLVFAVNDEYLPQIISNAVELKARGAYIIGVSPVNNKVFDQWFPISDTGSISTLEHTVFTQLLAYYAALFKGLDPDKPRNLAKSVTVK